MTKSIHKFSLACQPAVEPHQSPAATRWSAQCSTNGTRPRIELQLCCCVVLCAVVSPVFIDDAIKACPIRALLATEDRVPVKSAIQMNQFWSQPPTGVPHQKVPLTFFKGFITARYGGYPRT